MKELNIEEKAQRYDEAIDVCRKLYSKAKADGYTSDIEDYEQMFPELAESEDERIRKALIRCFSGFEKDSSTWGGFKRKDIIAWLEAQGEQKPILDNALKEAFDKSMKDYSLEEKKEASDYSESIIPTSIACGESEEEYMLHKIIEAAYITGKNSVQKPAWSEEDNKIIDNLISQLGNLYTSKLIKEETKDKYVNWLKSLRPQNRWKPTEVQMSMLRAIVNEPNNVGAESCHLAMESLYNDLKNL